MGGSPLGEAPAPVLASDGPEDGLTRVEAALKKRPQYGIRMSS
jgi:hypothetical protein